MANDSMENVRVLLSIARTVQDDYKDKLDKLQQEYNEKSNLLASLIEVELKGLET